MAHSVGALLLPAAPASSGSHGDPAIDVLIDFFEAVLKSWIETAWLARAPGEPLIRTVIKGDPEETLFGINDLPTLCLWRHEDSEPNRLADGFQEEQNQIRILWIPPTAIHDNSADRFAFFNAFQSAISAAVLHERHPSYIHSDDVGDPAAVAYGSDVLGKCVFDWWRLTGRIQRVPVDIQMGSSAETFTGYLATLLVGETVVTDNTAFGVFATVIDGETNSGGDTPLTTNDFLIPKDS